MSTEDVYARRGFGGRQGAGEHPAVIVVDLIEGFTNPESRLACDADGAVGATRVLLDAARRSAVPVIFTTVSYTDDDLERAAMFIAKAPSLATLRPGSRWVEVDARLARGADELVITKLLRLGVLRHPARRGPARGRLRHRGGRRGLDIGLRAGYSRRRPAVRVPRSRPEGGSGRPGGGRASRIAPRPRRQVRRRDLACRGDRSGRGQRPLGRGLSRADRCRDLVCARSAQSAARSRRALFPVRRGR